MDMHSFVNRLRIMISLDGWELVGLSKHMTERFLADPYRTMMRMDEDNLRIVWDAIERRAAPKAVTDFASALELVRQVQESKQ